jgi:hypothetical protein
LAGGFSRKVGGVVVPAVVGPDGIVPPEVVVCVAAAVVVGAAGVVVVVVVVGEAGRVVGLTGVPPFVVAVVADGAGFTAPTAAVWLVDVVPDRLATNVDPLCPPGVSTGESPAGVVADLAAAAIAVSGPLVHRPVRTAAEPDALCDEGVSELELDAIGEM